MSKDSAPLPPPAFTQPTASWKIQNFTAPPVAVAQSTLETTWYSKAGSVGKGKTSVKKERKSTVGVGVASGSKPTLVKKDDAANSPAQKRRKLFPEDEEMRNRTASNVALNLATDHIMTLFPDTETPFLDEIDVVSRLLPYHVFQYPKGDLHAMIHAGKGKAKATPEEELREEIKESKFAISCHKRFHALEKRLHRARIKPGEYTAPHSQAIHLERMVIEGDRAATTFLEQDLAAAKSELDKIVRAKRIAAVNASRQASSSSKFPSSSSNTYGYSTKPIMSTTTSSQAGTSFSHYYSSYTYPYTQAVPYNPTALSYPMDPTSTRTTPTPVSTLQVNPASSGPAASTASTSKPAASTNASQTPSTVNASTTAPIISTTSTTSTTPRLPVMIPLQIPVASLPALRSLGIMPVPKAALPPPSEPQPAAVLIGSTAGGSMLSIEVNAALLQAPQMSGLAILLSGLVTMGNGRARAGGGVAIANADAETAATSASTVEMAAEGAAERIVHASSKKS